MRGPASLVWALLTALAAIVPAKAQAPDTILLKANGKVVPLTTRPVGGAGRPRRPGSLRSGARQRYGRWQGRQRHVVDLGGRAVIPGLIDLTSTPSAPASPGAPRSTGSACARLPRRSTACVRRRARRREALGSWWPVVGLSGSSPRTAAQVRRRSSAAAPGRHVYIQQLYSRVLLDPGGYEALGIAAHPELAARVKIERDAAGTLTGWLTGDNRTLSELFDLLPQPSFEQKVEGTRAFFRKLNAVGLTGAIDPGGYNLPVADYQALFALWREHGLELACALQPLRAASRS